MQRRLTPRSETFGLSLIEELTLIYRGHLATRPFTLSEVGEVLGVSSSRVLQIEQQALAKAAVALARRREAQCAQPSPQDTQHADLTAFAALSYVDTRRQR